MLLVLELLTSLPIAATVAAANIAGIAVVVAIAATAAVVAATAVAVAVAKTFGKSTSSGIFDWIVLARRILAGYRPLCSHTPGYMYSATTPPRQHKRERHVNSCKKGQRSRAACTINVSRGKAG